jgi:hypothetical protein
MFLQLLLLCFAVLSLGSNFTFEERTDIAGLYIRRSNETTPFQKNNSFRMPFLNKTRKTPVAKLIYDSSRVKTLQNDKPTPTVILASYLRRRTDFAHPGYLRKEREAFGPMNAPQNNETNNPANKFCTSRIMHYLLLLFFHL